MTVIEAIIITNIMTNMELIHPSNTGLTVLVSFGD